MLNASDEYNFFDFFVLVSICCQFLFNVDCNYPANVDFHLTLNFFHLSLNLFIICRYSLKSEFCSANFELIRGHAPSCHVDYSDSLRYSHIAQDKGYFDISADKELACSTIVAWAYELESTIRYLGIEFDDALEITEQTVV